LRRDIISFLAFWISLRIEKIFFHNRRNLLLAINQINPRGRHNNARIARARLPKKLTIQIVAWELGIDEWPSFSLFLVGFNAG
jgi:hypothetical protein